MYETIIKYGIVSTMAVSSLSNALEHRMTKGNNIIEPPIDTVTIIIPTYNEEQYIEQCLSSLTNQSIVHQYPNYFEYILVDSQSTDNTVQLAEPYVDKIIIAPKGKLTSRILATQQSNGNIIVSVDSDSIYQYNWLNSLLEPFRTYSNVAAVVGSTIDKTIPYIPGSLYTVGAVLDRTLIHPNQIIGRNSAYWKHLFYLSGQFNTNINQLRIDQIYDEEELNFGKRLSQYGNIVFKLEASCIHLGGMRIGCRFRLINDKSCEDLGKNRF